MRTQQIYGAILIWGDGSKELRLTGSLKDRDDWYIAQIQEVVNDEGIETDPIETLSDCEEVFDALMEEGVYTAHFNETVTIDD